MKKYKHQLFIAENMRQAQKAVVYKNTNRNKRVIILTSNLEVMLFLEQQGVLENQVSKIIYSNRSFYSLEIKQIAQNARFKFEQYRTRYASIKLLHTPIYEALGIIIEANFAQVFYMKQMLGKLYEKLSVESFLVPAGNPPSNFVKWLKISVPQNLIQEYQSPSPTIIHKQFGFYLSALIRLFTNLVYGLINWLVYMKPIIKPISTKTLLLSAGMNLRFYSSVFKQQRLNKATILASTQTYKDDYLLNQDGVSYYALEKTVDIKTLKRQAKDISKTLHNKLKHLPRTNNQTALDKWLYEFVNQIITQRLEKTVLQILVASQVLDKFKPNILVTTHDPAPSITPFVFEALARRINTVVLLHGWSDLILGENYYSEKIVVWGEYMKRWYHRVLGKKNSSVLVGGFPYYDDFIQKYAFWLHDKQSINKNKPVLGLLLTYYLVDTFSIERSIFQLFKSAQLVAFPGEIWIRTHPGQQIENIEKIAKHFQVRIKYNQPADINEFINGCDFVLSWDTSAINIAMIHGKPLLFSSPLWGEKYTPIRCYQAANIPKNAADVFRFITEFNEEQHKIMQRNQLRFLRDVIGYSPKQTATQLTKKIFNHRFYFK